MQYNVKPESPRQSTLDESKSHSPAGTESPASVSAARRRLLRGGLGVIPVALAITTRPARAALQCLTPSAYGSMNASRVENIQICSGQTPEFWKDSLYFDKWPHPYYPKSDATFGYAATEFHAMGCSGGQFGSKTMLEVLEMGTGGGELGAYIVAGVLNAADGRTPVLDVPAVLNLWNECSAQGYYEAVAGVQWSPGQVVQYLKTTMSV